MSTRAIRSGRAVLIGEERHRTADDRTGGEWAEVPPVQAVRNGRIHEEHFAWPKRPAAAPSRQGAAEMVTLTRIADGDAVDRDGVADAAYGLSRQRHDMLQQRHALGQETAVSQEARDRLGWPDRDQLHPIQPANRTQRVEPSRCAGRGVPDQPRRRE